VAKPAEYDRVSSYGYALGYLGGGLLFAVNVLMVAKPAWFGLANAAAAVRWSFISVAVWWLVFLLPLAFYVTEQPGLPGAGGKGSLRASLAELRQTLRHVLGYRNMLIFLVAYWLYIDGVNTIVKMAVDYGMALGFDTQLLLTALLLTQFVAFPAALLFGRIGERLGARTGVLIGIAVYAGVTAWAYYLHTVVQFFAMAVVIGLVQGGVQSLSRSFFGRLVPEGKSAEFFGFFNMVGKFGTVLGPLLVGFVAYLTGSSRVSILSLVLLFVAGGLLLLWVKDPAGEAGRRELSA
jgi:UMF1 family MFS transporter